MPSTATVSGKTGPGDTATTAVLSNVTRWEVVPGNYVRVFYGGGLVADFDATQITTMTSTVSNNNWVLTIS